jgi:hypothetical protein
MLSGTEELVQEVGPTEVKRVVEVPEARHLSGASVCTPPARWDETQLRRWLTRFKTGRFSNLVQALPSGMAGKEITRMGQRQLTAGVCAGNERVGKELYDALRAAMAEADNQDALRRKNMRQAAQNAKTAV